MGVRKSARWMKQVDDRILEHLDESGESKPSMMAQHPRFDDMTVSTGQVRDRCRVLAAANMLVRDDLGWFDITRWGQLYLRGDLDAENQPEPHRHGIKILYRAMPEP